MTREPMSTPEETPQLDELARKREERASAGEPAELRDRVREDARRTARRIAAAERARRRSGPPVVPPDGGSGGASGAA
jgi:hypothetical protein